MSCDAEMHHMNIRNLNKTYPDDAYLVSLFSKINFIYQNKAISNFKFNKILISMVKNNERFCFVHGILQSLNLITMQQFTGHDENNGILLTKANRGSTEDNFTTF